MLIKSISVVIESGGGDTIKVEFIQEEAIRKLLASETTLSEIVYAAVQSVSSSSGFTATTTGTK